LILLDYFRCRELYPHIDPQSGERSSPDRNEHRDLSHRGPARRLVAAAAGDDIAGTELIIRRLLLLSFEARNCPPWPRPGIGRAGSKSLSPLQYTPSIQLLRMGPVTGTEKDPQIA
jgi:hypothetical protein